MNVVQPESTEQLKGRNLLTDVFFRHHPIRVIPQGKTISFSLAMGWDLLGNNPLPPFQVDLEYTDIDDVEYFSSLTLDIREMEKLGAERSPTMRAVDALEKIAKKL